MSDDPGRPSWMQGGGSSSETRGERTQKKSYIKSAIPSETPTVHDGRVVRSGDFPLSVVVGVKIIASIMLLNACTTVVLVFLALIDTGASNLGGAGYFSTWKIIVSLTIGIAASILIWKVVAETSV